MNDKIHEQILIAKHSSLHHISFENHECIDGASLLGYYFNHYNDSGMILHQ